MPHIDSLTIWAFQLFEYRIEKPENNRIFEYLNNLPIVKNINKKKKIVIV